MTSTTSRESSEKSLYAGAVQLNNANIIAKLRQVFSIWIYDEFLALFLFMQQNQTLAQDLQKAVAEINRQKVNVQSLLDGLKQEER